MSNIFTVILTCMTHKLLIHNKYKRIAWIGRLMVCCVFIVVILTGYENMKLHAEPFFKKVGSYDECPT